MSDSLGVSARFVDDGDAALLAEGRIGQNDIVFAVLRGQNGRGGLRQTPPTSRSGGQSRRRRPFICLNRKVEDLPFGARGNESHSQLCALLYV